MEMPAAAPLPTELPPTAAAPPPTEPSTPAAALAWSTVLKKQPQLTPLPPAVPSRVFGVCDSSKGISVAVVDANVLIHGDKLNGCADKFVSVREVLDEVRDPASRRRIAFLPFPVETMEPSPEFIKKVVKFARETGDLQTLSDVDLKLIALTLMLEAQAHGTDHLRDSPPPLRVVNVKNLAEAEMPGWGSNVPNIAEWEALDEETEVANVVGSRILPLKDLNDQAIPELESGKPTEEMESDKQFSGRPRRPFPPKKEIILDGKKMVSDGVDASHGEDTENTGDWKPAVSRSTHRRFLKRRARREALGKHDNPSDNANTDNKVNEGDDAGSLSDDDSECVDFDKSEKNLSAKTEQQEDGLEQIYETDSFEKSGYQLDIKEHNIPNADNESDHPLSSGDLVDATTTTTEDQVEICERELNGLEISSQSNDGGDTAHTDDASSEQSWRLRSLSDSSVACVTSDYAMQNVILQIGLRLLAPGGMQIRQLHRWVLKCHACNKVTQEIGRIFCPKCGNGGTLRKVSVTVGENGIVMAARRQRFILRGTKFSLPMPHGGRDAITKNPILREDQLPRKFLYPKQRKSTKQDQDLLTSDDIFTNPNEKRTAPLKPPVRRAIAVFSGKRNPNDNHFSRPKH